MLSVSNSATVENFNGRLPTREACPLASPSRNTPNGQADEQKQGGSKSETKDGGSGPHRAKRKYRRHPKPDENAPERPPSAYVGFCNKMREELKGRNLSFTEIAILVGENWRNLSPAEKELYEKQAFSAKERYNNELAEYKKSNQYKEYSQYLAEFKARQSNQQQDAAKRPKLEAHQSTASSGTASSGASVRGGTPTGRMRVEDRVSSSIAPSPCAVNSVAASASPAGLGSSSTFGPGPSARRQVPFV